MIHDVSPTRKRGIRSKPSLASRLVSKRLFLSLIALYQSVNVRHIAICQLAVMDYEDVLRVLLGRVRQVMAAGDDRVVGHHDLVVHEIVFAGRGVRRRALAREFGGHVLEYGNLPRRRAGLPLLYHRCHLRLIVNATEFGQMTLLQHVAQRARMPPDVMSIEPIFNRVRALRIRCATSRSMDRPSPGENATLIRFPPTETVPTSWAPVVAMSLFPTVR